MSDKMRTAWLALTLLMAVAAATLACTPKTDTRNNPKGKLSEYIAKSFSIHEVGDRAQLLGLLTGEAKTRLAAWSDEQFRQAFLDSKRQFLKLVVTETKNVSDTETSLTYELTYLDQARDTKVTQKKVAQLTQEDGRWLIKGVFNIKELVEYQNEMSLP